MAISNYLQSAMMILSAERLTYRLRSLVFRGILRQDIGWFDRSENTTGALSARLATDASAVAGLTGQNLAMIVNIAATLLAGLIIAFTASWRLAFIVLACLPMVRARKRFLSTWSSDIAD